MKLETSLFDIGKHVPFLFEARRSGTENKGK